MEGREDGTILVHLAHSKARVGSIELFSLFSKAE